MMQSSIRVCQQKLIDLSRLLDAISTQNYLRFSQEFHWFLFILGKKSFLITKVIFTIILVGKFTFILVAIFIEKKPEKYREKESYHYHVENSIEKY